MRARDSPTVTLDERRQRIYADVMDEWCDAYREGPSVRELVAADARCKLLAPQSVSACRWSARHESSLSDPSFAALRRDIARMGGNSVPVLVRSLQDVDGYELVYGERRLRACRELGLPLHAIVSRMSDHAAARARVGLA